MFQRYCELRPFLPHVQHEELKDILLDPVDDFEVNILLKRLADLESVTLEL